VARVGLLCSLIRVEEKLLLQELRKRDGVELTKIDDRKLVLDLHEKELPYDVVLERCINHSRALHTLKIFNDRGVPTVNSAPVAWTCGDKLLTTNALVMAGVPTPDARVAYTPESAIEAIEELGYPVVLKPAVGSWGRLLAKINDRESAEAILDHKRTLGTYHHSIYYIQKYVPKNGFDIRAFVVGNETICAIKRESEHWITNTARGAQASVYEVSRELDEICVAAAEAVGGGVLAVDVFKDSGGYSINEVNYTMEFKNSIEPTGIDIPAKVVDYVLSVARGSA
jgi:[lysine-biosynthesis-protein LysW]--L-2-aminoadipate ligase